MRYRPSLSGLLLLSLLSSPGCSRTAVAIRAEVEPVLPPAALLTRRPEPACRPTRNADLVQCITDLREWGRQCEGDRAALAGWRTGAEQAASLPETPQEPRPWWRPW